MILFWTSSLGLLALMSMCLVLGENEEFLMMARAA